MNKLFCVEGFGEVGEANLAGFVPHAGYKPYQDLEINEMSVGTASLCGSRDVIRIWRIG